MGQWFQRLRANAKYGSINDATIQGYLRAASQLENVWQQIDDKVNELILQGLPAWEAYTRMAYALAFVRACRMNVVFVQELLKAETATDSANAGYLPKITYDQALALCEHIEPTIEEAIKASTNSRYVLPSSTLPLTFGPHIGGVSASLPLSHLQGFIRAGQEMKDWTAGLLAQYELALHAAKQPLPSDVSAHLEQMKSELELGDFHLRTGIDMVGQISQGKVAEALHQKTEGFLWEAMESFYRVSQLLAMPDLRTHTTRQNAPARMPSSAAPAQIAPIQRLPDPPEPVAIDLLKQIIAEPASAPVPKAPAPATSDALNMLNQLASSSQTQPREAPQQLPETTGLLAQGGSFSKERPQAADVSVTNFAGLLAQEPESTPRVPERGHKAVERKPRQASTDNALDLLSEICGEQEKPGN